MQYGIKEFLPNYEPITAETNAENMFYSASSGKFLVKIVTKNSQGTTITTAAISPKDHLLLGIHLLAFCQIPTTSSFMSSLGFGPTEQKISDTLNDCLAALQVAINEKLDVAHYYKAKALALIDKRNQNNLNQPAINEHYKNALNANRTAEDVISFFNQNVPRLQYLNRSDLKSFDQVLAEINSYPHLSDHELLHELEKAPNSEGYGKALTYRYIKHDHPEALEYILLAACYGVKPAKKCLDDTFLVGFSDILALDLERYLFAEQLQFLHCFSAFCWIFNKLLSDADHPFQRDKKVRQFIFMWDLFRIMNNRSIRTNKDLKNHIKDSAEEHMLKVANTHLFQDLRKGLVDLVTDDQFDKLVAAATTFYYFLVFQANRQEPGPTNFPRLLLNTIPKADDNSQIISEPTRQKLPTQYSLATFLPTYPGPDYKNVPASATLFFELVSSKFHIDFPGCDNFKELSAKEHLLLGIHLLAFYQHPEYPYSEEKVGYISFEYTDAIMKDIFAALDVAIKANLFIAHYFKAKAELDYSRHYKALASVNEKDRQDKRDLAKNHYDKAIIHYQNSLEANFTAKDIVDFFNQFVPLLNYLKPYDLKTFEDVLEEINAIKSSWSENNAYICHIIRDDHIKDNTNLSYVIISACYGFKPAKKWIADNLGEIVNYIDTLAVDIKQHTFNEQCTINIFFLEFLSIYQYLKRNRDQRNQTDRQQVFMRDLFKIMNTEKMTRQDLTDYIKKTGEDHGLTAANYLFFKGTQNFQDRRLNLVRHGETLTDDLVMKISIAAKNFYQCLVMMAKQNEANFAKVLLNSITQSDEVETQLDTRAKTVSSAPRVNFDYDSDEEDEKSDSENNINL